VKWAMVFVKSGLNGKTFEPPKEPILLDQQGCMYSPHVFGVMAGQEIKIRNSDGFLHNIHGLPFTNKEFNIAQQGGQENKVVWRQPESQIKVKCDIHSWMKSWGHVFEHPFFSVTDDAGKFAIKNLPAGKYTIEVWHEAYKSVTQQIEVKEGPPAAVDFELAEKKE
jgi:plastocyanin